MSDKKAQVTLVIIIGLILIAGAAVTLYVTTMPAVEEEIELISKVPAEIQPIYKYVDECIESTAIPAIRLLGAQGGYISLPQDYYSFEGNDVAYLYDNGENKVPTITEMEAQLALYVNNAVTACTGEFEVFKEQGFEITTTDIITNAQINENNVVFDITYPVKIKKGESLTEVSAFRYVSNIRLGYVHSAASRIIEKIVEEPDYIDMTYLESFKLKIDVIPAETDSHLYSIKDDEYLFLFSVRFAVNIPPEIEGLAEESFRIKDNAPFSYKINVADEGAVVLEDNTAMFDISEDGWIRFTPDVTGTFEAEITATDRQGEQDKKKMIFVVEEE